MVYYNAQNKPLVSVIVITFNSSQFVLETLESVKQQTYENIELIVSDDGSSDNTTQICTKWLAENQSHFSRTNLLTVKKNTGIPANCNRGVNNSTGEWIKIIAADDVLLKNCIEDNIKYVLENNNVEALQTISKYYTDEFISSNYIANSPTDKVFFYKKAEEQHKFLKIRNEVIAPSMFLKKEAILRVKGFDEEFRFFEDITMWLNLTKNGIKIHYHPVSTVKYRIHSGSVAKNGKQHMSSSQSREILLYSKKYYTKEEKRKLYYLKKIFKLKLIIFYDQIGLNNSSLFSKYLYMITWKLLR